MNGGLEAKIQEGFVAIPFPMLFFHCPTFHYITAQRRKILPSYVIVLFLQLKSRYFLLSSHIQSSLSPKISHCYVSRPKFP